MNQPMNRRTKLLQASIALAERSMGTTNEARLQHHADEASRLQDRANRQQKAAFRLQKWAGVAA